MATEDSLKILSGQVYRLDSKSEDYDPELKVGEIEEFAGVEYKTLKVEDNTTNGMQATAVAPVKNGKVDTSEVVIAFAGPNPADMLDRMTDYFY